MNQLLVKTVSKPLGSVRSRMSVPAIVADAAENAARRFLKFFAATIRNKSTRIAYYGAVREFAAWVDRRKIGQRITI